MIGWVGLVSRISPVGWVGLASPVGLAGWGAPRQMTVRAS